MKEVSELGCLANVAEIKAHQAVRLMPLHTLMYSVIRTPQMVEIIKVKPSQSQRWGGYITAVDKYRRALKFVSII